MIRGNGIQLICSRRKFAASTPEDSPTYNPDPTCKASMPAERAPEATRRLEATTPGCKPIWRVNHWNLTYLKQTSHVQWDLKDNTLNFELEWHLKAMGLAWLCLISVESHGNHGKSWKIGIEMECTKTLPTITGLRDQEEYLQRWSVEHGTSRREYGNSQFASAIASIASSGFGMHMQKLKRCEGRIWSLTIWREDNIE